MTARELMTSPVETIRRYEHATEAAARMRKLHLNRLLVMDDEDTPVGVISISDLIAAIGRPSGERAAVRDVMSYAIVTCRPETPIVAAARAMTERRSRSIIVVNASGAAVGVLTGNDLLAFYDQGERVSAAGDPMSTSLITAAPELSLADAADIMLDREVHRLVVVDSAQPGGQPIGIVSTSDILASMASEHSVWQRKRA